MGRVNRYKKYKACDPNSKRFGKELDTKSDEPPELFEQRARKLNRDREDKWDDEEKREHLLQREAIREMRMNKQNDLRKEKTLESRRPDETLQAFKQRIKQETRKTLVEEVHKMTATAQKRKLRLKERSQKRKLKKGGKAGEEKEEVEFFAAENGHLRPSDLGESRSSFAAADHIAFGERADRPPELNKFTAKFRVTKKTSDDDAQERAAAQSDSEGDGSASGAESEESEEEVALTKNQRNKKRKARGGLAQRSDLDGDDGLEGSLYAAAAESAMLSRAIAKSNPAVGAGNKKAKVAQSGGSSVNNSSGKNSNSSVGSAKKPEVKKGVKDQNEMEALRVKVQEAYRLMKEKRRLQG